MEWGTLSSVAVALSIASLCIRWRLPSVPGFVASAGLGVSFGVLGLSLYPIPVFPAASLTLNLALVFGILDFWLFAPRDAEGEAEGALLRLTFYGDDRHPTALQCRNVGTWFAYHSPHARIEAAGEDGSRTTLATVPKAWAIFIEYECPTEVRQIVASFNAAGLPPYNVLLSTKRASVIAFSGDLPSGDLEIDVRH